MGGDRATQNAGKRSNPVEECSAGSMKGGGGGAGNTWGFAAWRGQVGENCTAAGFRWGRGLRKQKKKKWERQRGKGGECLRVKKGEMPGGDSGLEAGRTISSRESMAAIHTHLPEVSIGFKCLRSYGKNRSRNHGQTELV